MTRGPAGDTLRSRPGSAAHMNTTSLTPKTAALALLALAAACDDIGSDGESLTPAGPPVGAEFEITSGSVTEATPSVVVAVTLPEPEDLGVGVIFDSVGSAEEGVDFDPVPLSVLIPAGETRAEFTITLRDDALFEDDEELVLEIVNLATAANVDIGEDRTLTLEIVDDDVAPPRRSQSGPRARSRTPDRSSCRSCSTRRQASRCACP